MQLKRIIAGIATFALAITAVATPFGNALPLPTVAQTASAETYSDYTYAVLSNGTVEISKYNGSASKVTIPSKIDGKKVTSIGYSAFAYCSGLISITIPNSVMSIGDFAFNGCENLTSITIPNSVTSIGNSAFFGCLNLESIVIPNGVTSIEYNAFTSCSKLTSIIIPNSVTSIGDYAFSFSGLTSITIPDSVTSIGGYAFVSCDSLTSINASKDNKNYCSVDGVLFNKAKTKIICYPAGKPDKYAIPDSVTSIGNGAFSYCTNLTNVTIPNSVTSIGNSAFYGCKVLTSITIPNSVTNIESSAFSSCSSLTSITIPDSVTSIGSAAFYWCFSLTDVYYTGTEAQWKKVRIGEYNSALDNANMHYNYNSGASSSLSAPTGLKLKGRANNALRIAWNKNTSADGYIVEMYKNNKWVRVAKIAKNSTIEWKQTGLAAGTAYKFRVKAYKMNGKTAVYSSYVTISARTNPSNVTGMKTLGRAKTAVRFGWKKNTSADGYIVEMYKNGKWVRAAKITKNSTVQFKKTGLKANTTYKFRIRAYKMSGSTALYSGYTNFNISTTK